MKLTYDKFAVLYYIGLIGPGIVDVFEAVNASCMCMYQGATIDKELRTALCMMKRGTSIRSSGSGTTFSCMQCQCMHLIDGD